MHVYAWKLAILMVFDIFLGKMIHGNVTFVKKVHAFGE